MTKEQLKQQFEIAGVTARDFIRWAEGHGVTVHDSTISRHLAGKQGITTPWALAYLYYFETLKNSEK